jgi:hypothetical protein
LQKEIENQERERKERENERLERKKLEEQKEEERDKTVSMLEKKRFIKGEDRLRGKILSTKISLPEGNSKLKKAMEEQNMQCASVAKMIISTATSQDEKPRKEMVI